MTVRHAENDLSHCRAIAAFSVRTGQFHAHLCKAAKFVARTKNVRYGSEADIAAALAMSAIPQERTNSEAVGLSAKCQHRH